MKVYLDNGATTKVAKEVIDSMLPCFSDIYGNASSLHSLGRDALELIDNSRIVIAKKINARPNEIIFTAGGTESDNLAIRGFALANESKGRHIITTKIEHPAVYNTLEQLSKEGFSVTYLDVSSEGLIDLSDLRNAIREDTILVSIIHGNNEIGTLQNIFEIGEICKDKKVVFHSDAVQSFTKVLIDVTKININMISMSSHKIHGPKGVGALYVKKGTKIKSIVKGGVHEFKLRAGTENVPGIVGFSRAVEIADESDNSRMAELRDYLIEGLLKIPDSFLNGSKENRLCNNVNIGFKYLEGEGILMHLDMQGISVSTGSACSSHSLQASHVLLAIGLEHEFAHGCIRFTLSKYTTKEELDYTIEKVVEVVANLRKFSPLVN